MTVGTPLAPQRRARTRRAAAGLTAALVLAGLAACSADGGATAGRGRTTTTAATGTTGPQPDGEGPRPIDPDAAPDPDVDDVTDEVFDDLGDPRIDVSHYAVVVTADPGRPELRGTATLTLTALTAEPLADLTLDLRGPVVSEATVDGEPAEVADADPDEIRITPAEPIEPGTEAEVVLTYAGEPDQDEFPGLGVPVGWQPDDVGGWFTMSEPNGTSTWVPASDHPSDKATWSITLDTPDDVVGVANGRLVSQESAEGRTAWVWETDEPMATYLVLAAVGDYDLVQRAGPDDAQVVFAFPSDLPAEDRAGFDDLDAIVDYFGETFGEYPDDDLGAIVVPTSLGLALENQTRPLFGLDAVGEGEVWALAHELAHQWFGNAVSPARWDDLWLNESFATYADWLWRDHAGEADIAVLAERVGVPRQGGLAVTDPEAAASFDGVIYEGGARALHALRLTIGDEPFFELLRRWYAERDGTSASTDDFTALAEEVAGEDLDAFFDAWLRAPKQPALPD